MHPTYPIKVLSEYLFRCKDLQIDVVDLVDEVYEYLVSGKYGDAGASREKSERYEKKP